MNSYTHTRLFCLGSGDTDKQWLTNNNGTPELTASPNGTSFWNVQYNADHNAYTIQQQKAGNFLGNYLSADGTDSDVILSEKACYWDIIWNQSIESIHACQIVLSGNALSLIYLSGDTKTGALSMIDANEPSDGDQLWVDFSTNSIGS